PGPPVPWPGVSFLLYGAGSPAPWSIAAAVGSRLVLAIGAIVAGPVACGAVSFGLPSGIGSSVRARVLGGPGVVGLAARAAHDLGRVEDGARDLVVGEVGRAVRAQVGHGREGRPGSERDDRGHLLPPARARRADHQRVVDGRVALHHALHLLHVDLLAARVDAGRLAPEEDEAPVVGIPRAVAAEAVADAVDHRE